MRNTAHSKMLAQLMLGVSLAGGVGAVALTPVLYAQTPAAVRALGTVKSIAGDTISLTTAAGAEVTVMVPAGATVLQLPPGSTDLKAGTPTSITNIAVGDRILATARPGDAAATPTSLTAARVVLMKSTDIAARQSAQQAEWQRNGVGGLVRAVDGPVLTMSSGARTIKVETTPTTIFRRYADDSVKFEDAKAGTLDQVRSGDQISVRGTKSEDGMSIAAAEVVTGTFENLSGPITAVDASAGTLTIRDLTTKKTLTVHVTPNSDVRALPAQAAAMFAARNAGGAAAGAPAPAPRGGAPVPSAAAQGSMAGGEARPHNAGMDLSRMLSRLPTQTLAELKPGAAVMIVAALDRSGAESLTAITLLSGVEPLLTATSAGSQPITLSPWNLGAPEGAGGGPQ